MTPDPADPHYVPCPFCDCPDVDVTDGDGVCPECDQIVEADDA